jgi:rSAM/selenodomain-associated transferase 2
MRIAAVIPTLNEGARLAGCVMGLRALGLDQLVVVDGGSTDDTVAVAHALGVCVLTAPRGRALQLDTGASSVDADVLWFVHADVQPPADALAHIRHTLADPTVVGGAFRTRTRPDSTPPWLTRFLPLADLRARRTLLPYGDQALFCRQEAYRRVGGFPPWPILEDVGLARRLWTVGRLVIAEACVSVSARRYADAPLYYAAVMNSFPLLWRAGVPPEWLARAYGDPR